MGDFSFIIESQDFVPDFSRRAADPMMKDIAKKLVSEAKTNIRQQREFDGVPFQKLSRNRIDVKRKEGYAQPNKALIATGKMLKSILARKLANAKYEIGVSKKIKYKAEGEKQRTIDGQRLSEIHTYHGAGAGRVLRIFLGWTKRADVYADRRVDRFVEERFKKARDKKITIKV